MDFRERAACMRAARLGGLAAQEAALADARAQVGLPATDIEAAEALSAAGRALTGRARRAYNDAYTDAYYDAAVEALVALTGGGAAGSVP